MVTNELVLVVTKELVLHAKADVRVVTKELVLHAKAGVREARNLRSASLEASNQRRPRKAKSFI